MIANNDPQLPSPSQQLVIAKPLLRESEAQQQSLPIDALLAAFRRRWKVGLPVGLCLGVLGAVAAWIAFAPKYTASAYLRLHAEEQTLMPSQSGSTQADFKLYKNTQLQAMKTPFVLNAALKETGIMDLPEIQAQVDPVNWLGDQLDASYPRDGEIMRLSITTGSAKSSVKLVNAIVAAFEKQVVVVERDNKLAVYRDLEKIYKDEKGVVRDMRSQLKKFSSQLGSGNADSLTLQQQGDLELYAKMRQHLFDVRIQRRSAETSLAIAKQKRSEFDQLVANAKFNQEVDQGANIDLPKSPEIQRMELELAQLKIDLTSKYAGVASGHPSYVKVKREIEVREAALVDLKEEAQRVAKLNLQQRLAAGVPDPNLPQPPVSDSELLALESRVASLKENEESLTKEAEELFDKVKLLGRSSEEADMLREEIEARAEFVRQMYDQLQLVGIELGDGDDENNQEKRSRIELLGEAKSATATDPRKRILRAAALGLAGLFGPLALLMIWDLSRRSVDNEQAVTRAIAYTNLGTIPYVPSEPLLLEDTRQLDRSNPKHAELTESVDSLSAMLLHRAEEEDRQVFMVSSAVAGEGKSTVACQLAKSLDSMGKRVVLVDFDLRRPSVHSYLKLGAAPGVREVLSGQTPWQKTVQNSSSGNLDVIVAGSPTSRLRETINSGSVAEFLSQLRSQYDLVIVDSSPILPVVDARLLGKFCDAVILTLVRDVSRIPLATQACEVLRSYGIHVFGTVVIGGKQSVYSKYYGDVELGNGKLGGGKDKSGKGKSGKQKLGHAESN